jgi:hypothetical protein
MLKWIFPKWAIIYPQFIIATEPARQGSLMNKVEIVSLILVISSFYQSGQLNIGEFLIEGFHTRHWI